MSQASDSTVSIVSEGDESKYESSITGDEDIEEKKTRYITDAAGGQDFNKIVSNPSVYKSIEM